jgi:hypothetical protein
VFVSEVSEVRVCPECECQFEEPIVVCPHCHVPLHERDEQEVDDVDGNLPCDGLIVIASTNDESEIGEIRELLEESGIPCFLSNELFPAEPSPRETLVLIPREMAIDAKRLMRSFVP